MLRKTIFLAFIAIISSLIISCSQDETQEVSQINIEDQKDYSVSSFDEDYATFTSSLSIIKRILHTEEPRTEVEKRTLIQNFANSSSNPEKLLKSMDLAAEELYNKTPAEQLEVLIKYKVLSATQAEFVGNMVDLVVDQYENQTEFNHLAVTISKNFSTDILSQRFKAEEINMLQFLGIGLLQNVLENEDKYYITTKDCESFLATAICGWTAVQVVAMVAVIAIETGTAGYAETVCSILQLAGVDLIDLAGIVVAQDANGNPVTLGQTLGLALDIVELGATQSQILCVAALTYGIYDVVYNVCCDVTEPPCDFQEDPCCDVFCAPGYYCVNGTCVIDPTHCVHGECPEGYICSNTSGECIENINPSGTLCNSDNDCPPDFSCVAGFCIAR